MVNKQDAPKSKLSYRVNKSGQLALVENDQNEDVQVKSNYINARLENGELTLRVGCTLLVDGERTINREVIVDTENKELKEILQDVLSPMQDAVENRAKLDAYEDGK